jgi:hypothetical protein
MSTLKSVKLDKKAREEKYAESAIASDGPEYPYGLQLNLDDETIEKLGLALPEVGKDLALVARVNVTAVSASENTYGGKKEKRRSITLQITEMCLEADEGEGKSASAALYGS